MKWSRSPMNNQLIPEDFVNHEQAAQLLGVTKGTLYNLGPQNGGPKRYRLGSRLLYKRSELTEWSLSRIQPLAG